MPTHSSCFIHGSLGLRICFRLLLRRKIGECLKTWGSISSCQSLAKASNTSHQDLQTSGWYTCASLVL